MAFKNKTILNPKTKQELTFLQTGKDTGGELLEMESTYHAHSKEPPAHYHPQQTEDFTVLSGELTVRIHGEVKVLKEGDQIHVPPNTVHAMWNATKGKTVVNWKVRPALETEYFLEMMTGLAIDGKTDEGGVPGIMQIALTANKYGHVFRLAKPPFFVQKIVFSLLAPFAYLAGYKPDYPKYID